MWYFLQSCSFSFYFVNVGHHVLSICWFRKGLEPNFGKVLWLSSVVTYELWPCNGFFFFFRNLIQKEYYHSWIEDDSQPLMRESSVSIQMNPTSINGEQTFSNNSCSRFPWSNLFPHYFGQVIKKKYKKNLYNALKWSAYQVFLCTITIGE